MSSKPATQPAKRPPLISPNREAVLSAITDLVEHGHKASRRRITEKTGLSMVVVDDNIGKLRDDGFIYPLYAGVFDLVDLTPDRPISVTAMPRGRYKIELGDDVCDMMTPRETLALAKLLGGVALAFGSAG